MMVEAVRLLLALIALAASYTFSEQIAKFAHLPPGPTGSLLATIVGTGIGYIVAGSAARRLDRVMHHAEARLSRRHASEVLAGTVGLLVGLLLASVVAWPL